MGKFKSSLTAMAVVVALGACSEQKAPETTSADAQPTTASQQAQFDNVLLQEFKGPYGGVPAFNKMNLEDLKPALEKAMELNLKEIEAIANNEAPPTFDNVIVEMERAGAELGRVFTTTVFGALTNLALNSARFRQKCHLRCQHSSLKSRKMKSYLKE